MATRSIQHTLSRWLAVQTFVCLSVTSVVIYLVAHQSFKFTESEEMLRHDGQIRHVYKDAHNSGEWAALGVRLRDFFHTHQDLGAELRRNGELIFEAKPNNVSRTWRWERMPQDSYRPEMELTLGIDIASNRRVLQRLGVALFFISLTVSAIVSLLGSRLVRKGLRPLKALANETQSIGPHKAGVRIDSRAYGSEIVPFVLQFNCMLDRAEQAYQQLEAFNADVAHELRRPLANLVSQAEVELSRPRSAQELHETLLSVLEEARSLSGLVSDMLFLSRADRGVVARRTHVASVREDLLAVVDFHQHEVEKRNVTVKINGDAEADVDSGLIRRALSNLFSNALRYAHPFTSIDVDVSLTSGALWITVTNVGPELPAAPGTDIFKRFVRGDKGRSGDHHGLGLAIVAAIARMHHGHTRAFSANGETTIGFSVSRTSTPNEGTANAIAKSASVSFRDGVHSSISSAFLGRVRFYRGGKCFISR